MAASAADQRSQAGQQFFHMERLGQVVVGTGVDAGHLLVPAVARGEDQHRHRAAACPPFAQHGDAIHLRQAEVEHHCVVGFVVAQVMPVDAVAGGIHGVTGGAKAFGQLRLQGRFVFNDQDAHQLLLPSSLRRWPCRSCSCSAPLRSFLPMTAPVRASTLSLTSAPPVRSSLIL